MLEITIKNRKIRKFTQNQKRLVKKILNPQGLKDLSLRVSLFHHIKDNMNRKVSKLTLNININNMTKLDYKEKKKSNNS
jgi:hypothetical protein